MEVRPVGVSKGASMERILQYMAGGWLPVPPCSAVLWGQPRAALCPSCPCTTSPPLVPHAGNSGLADTDFVFVGGHFLARDENVFTLFEGQEPGAGGGSGGAPQVRLMAGGGRPPACVHARLGVCALVDWGSAGCAWASGAQPCRGRSAPLALQADALLSTLLSHDLDHLPPSITPGRPRGASLASSCGNLAALPEEGGSAEGSGGEGGSAEGGERADNRGQPPQDTQQQAGDGGSGALARSPGGGGAENGRARGSGTRGNGGGGGSDGLPFHLPPKYLFTCTVGRSMASKARCAPQFALPPLSLSGPAAAARQSSACPANASPPAPPRSYSLGGSMEVAMLLHKMAMADGIPASQARSLPPPLLCRAACSAQLCHTGLSLTLPCCAHCAAAHARHEHKRVL